LNGKKKKWKREKESKKRKTGYFIVQIVTDSDFGNEADQTSFYGWTFLLCASLHFLDAEEEKEKMKRTHVAPLFLDSMTWGFLAFLAKKTKGKNVPRLCCVRREKQKRIGKGRNTI